MRDELAHAKVMIVDDEEMVVKSISNFLELETSYKVLGFTSPEDAVRAVENEPIDLVIADFLMPEMNGIEFLRKVKEICPEATRILLTGYADKENAIRAINEVGLYYYAEKPWNNEDLKLQIRNGLEKRFLIKRLREILGELLPYFT